MEACGTSLVRLDAGKDLLEAVKEYAEKNKIGGAAFFAIGGLRKARFGILKVDKTGAPVEPTTYEPVEFAEPNAVYELLSCIGDVSKLGKDTIVHAHIQVADHEGLAHGGHLLPGSVIYPTLELAIFPTGPAKRQYDKNVKLNLLVKQ